MSIYDGAVCPYCNKPIDEQELAVCPDCGTPYHRSCYLKHKKCVNEARHAEGYDWRENRRPVELIPPELDHLVVCPNCGKQISESDRFCNYCGCDTKKKPLLGRLGENLPTESILFRNSDGEVEELNLEEEVDGVKLRDWKTYVGTSAGYYLFQLKMQKDTGRKMGFTLSAALFPFIYFLYRKMWGVAAISFAGNLLLGFPTFLNELVTMLGLDIGIPAATLLKVANVCGYLVIAVDFLWGVFAVYLYRLSAGKRIREFKAASSDEKEYQALLRRNAGPSMLAVQIVFSVLLLLTFVTLVFL